MANALLVIAWITFIVFVGMQFVALYFSYSRKNPHPYISFERIGGTTLTHSTWSWLTAFGRTVSIALMTYRIGRATKTDSNVVAYILTGIALVISVVYVILIHTVLDTSRYAGYEHYLQRLRIFMVVVVFDIIMVVTETFLVYYGLADSGEINGWSFGTVTVMIGGVLRIGGGMYNVWEEIRKIRNPNHDVATPDIVV